jgi:anti-anti-sigma regulatory factor
MLRIEIDCHGCVTRLQLSGRIQADHIASVQSAMSDCCERKILDLSEVTLVDLAVVRFLISFEDEGVELVKCPPYVREWILRERAEGMQWENG